MWVFEQHKQAITSIAMTPDGRFIISGSEDHTMRQWELDWELDMKEATSSEAEVGTQSTGLVNRITSLFNK
jgi:WD40 repeat protein